LDDTASFSEVSANPAPAKSGNGVAATTVLAGDFEKC
jgi:hypothetical protein